MNCIVVVVEVARIELSKSMKSLLLASTTEDWGRWNNMMGPRRINLKHFDI